MKTLKKSREIQVTNPDGDVYLSTWVGNENIGGGNIRLEDKIIAKGLLTDFRLGRGGDLKGKTLVVRTNGLDVNPYRDDIPATHHFKGTALQSDITCQYPEPADGNFEAGSDGLISYIVTYSFT